MWTGIPLFPEQASTFAREVDLLYLFLVGVSGFFTVAIFTLVFYFAVRYRRRHADEIPPAVAESATLEIAWSVIPLGITMVMFGWGAKLYFEMRKPPSEALQMWVVGKQWMWKMQHMEGRREINTLHVPVHQPIKLTMTSEDVIHSFYVPAFRIKQDVLPGRYTSAWFEATQPGEYHLFCTEYCGTLHSGMIGKVIAMDQAAFGAWLGGTEGDATVPVAEAGERIFADLGCPSCHRPDALARGPSLDGLAGREVRLADGAAVVADDDYLRESILYPRAKVVAGYEPLMPLYQGLISEEQVLQLVRYIKSLAPEPDREGAGELRPRSAR